jgi:hypothetical protein
MLTHRKQRLFIYLLLGPVPNGFAKLSVLFLLLEIFPRTAWHITSYYIDLGIVVVSLFYSISVLYTGIHCGPYRHEVCSVVTQLNISRAYQSDSRCLCDGNCHRRCLDSAYDNPSQDWSHFSILGWNTVNSRYLRLN